MCLKYYVKIVFSSIFVIELVDIMKYVRMLENFKGLNSKQLFFFYECYQFIMLYLNIEVKLLIM